MQLHNLLFLAQTGSENETAESTLEDKTGTFDTDPKSILDSIDNMWDGFISLLPQILIGVIVFAIFYFLSGFVRKLIRNYTKDKQNANVGRVMGRLAQWASLLLGLMLATAIIAPSVSPGDLLAGLGIGGVAIGFAFKDILQNFMSGILILLREPFRIGDQIKSGDFEGTVESIETRATMIKTYDGKRVVIPNSQIYTNPVVVNTAYDSRRSQYDVGVGCNDDLIEAADVMKRTMDQVDGVLSDPAPEVLVVELADSSVNLRCRWWTKSDQATVMKVQHEVIGQIKVALDDAAIDMPYPTQVHLFHDQTDEHDGDRKRQREGWPTNGQDPKATAQSRRESAETSR